MKKLTDDFNRAFDRCIEALSLNELSRRTGIGIYTLRKFTTRQTNSIRQETWEKMYPVLKPYINNEEEETPEIAPRVGAGARCHHDLVDLSSDQKVLLDTFGALSVKDKAHYLELFENELSGEVNDYELGSLSRDESHLLGMFDNLSAEQQQQYLLNIVELATLEVKRNRRQHKKI